MKFKLSDIKDLWREDEVEGFEHIETGDFVQDGKYQWCPMVFKYQDRFYCYDVQRSGSPFTDWVYEWEWMKKDAYVECYEVEKVEVVTTDWRVVRPSAERTVLFTSAPIERTEEYNRAHEPLDIS